jgi:hypothetical protein
MIWSASNRDISCRIGTRHCLRSRAEKALSFSIRSPFDTCEPMDKVAGWWWHQHIRYGTWNMGTWPNRIATMATDLVNSCCDNLKVNKSGKCIRKKVHGRLYSIFTFIGRVVIDVDKRWQVHYRINLKYSSFSVQGGHIEPYAVQRLSLMTHDFFGSHTFPYRIRRKFHNKGLPLQRFPQKRTRLTSAERGRQEKDLPFWATVQRPSKSNW